MPRSRLVIEIDPELHKRIRFVVVKKDTSIKDWLTPIIIKEVEREEASNGNEGR